MHSPIKPDGQDQAPARQASLGSEHPGADSGGTPQEIGTREFVWDFSVATPQDRYPGAPRPPRVESPTHLASLELLRCFQKALGHELPNQLVAIQGLARLSQYADDPDFPPQALLQRIVPLVSRTDQMVRALAEIGRLVQQASTPSDTPVSLDEVVREAAAAVKYLYPDLPIEYHFPASLPQLYVAHSVMYKLLVELMRNAVEATILDRPSASENVCKVRIEVGVREQKDSTCLTELWVRDRGPGLPSGSLQRLFEAFVRGPQRVIGSGVLSQGRPHQGDFKGTSRESSASPGKSLPCQKGEHFGLGLFLVRQVMASLGGALRVVSFDIQETNEGLKGASPDSGCLVALGFPSIAGSRQ